MNEGLRAAVSPGGEGCARDAPDQYSALTMRPPRLVPAAVLIGLAAFVLTEPPRAFDVPQSREDFVHAVSQGARGAKMETVVVERSFDDVYRALEARTSPCLDVEIHRT